MAYATFPLAFVVWFCNGFGSCNFVAFYRCFDKNSCLLFVFAVSRRVWSSSYLSFPLGTHLMAKALLTRGIVKPLTMLGAVRTVSLMKVPYLGLEHVYR